MTTTSPDHARLRLGAAYYPEHWPETCWAEDIRLMRAAGLSVVRMGEFAWSTLEPEEGCFDFDWLARAIDMLAEAGIDTVLGTPTAAPPAWLVQAHPDLLPIDEAGRQVQFGNRCHYCVTSPDLHAAARRIVSALAQRFAAHAHVIGWQIDNEFNRVCYCPRCARAFQQYLAAKFGALDELNARWSTRYWSQTYTSWEQIPLPNNWRQEPPCLHNPGLVLEFKRFITQAYWRFQELQAGILRPQLPGGVWLSHNFMGWRDGIDQYTLAGGLDLATWDWYVQGGRHSYVDDGAAHDLARGLKRQNYWVMEAQPGYVSFADVNSTLPAGEARAMAWQAVGHGADGFLYWQWRSALGGQEQYFGTLVDPSGRPRPFYEEAARLGLEFSKAGLLFGAKPASQIAIINCYDSRWSIGEQPHHCGFDYVAHLRHYYRPLATRNLGIDIICAGASLDGYKLVIAPALHIIDEDRAEQLAAFVQAGGHLVLTIRSGMKDMHNGLLPMRQPGLLAPAAGVEVREFYALLEPAPVQAGGQAGTSAMWAEWLDVIAAGEVEVLAHFGRCNGWLDGRPAVTAHTFGQGRIYYVAAYLDEALQEALLRHVAAQAGVRPVLDTPAGVEACRRVRADGSDVVVLINHTATRQAVDLPGCYFEHLACRQVAGALQLEPYGIAVLAAQKAGTS